VVIVPTNPPPPSINVTCYDYDKTLSQMWAVQNQAAVASSSADSDTYKVSAPGELAEGAELEGGLQAYAMLCYAMLCYAGVRVGWPAVYRGEAAAAGAAAAVGAAPCLGRGSSPPAMRVPRPMQLRAIATYGLQQDIDIVQARAPPPSPLAPCCHGRCCVCAVGSAGSAVPPIPPLSADRPCAPARGWRAERRHVGVQPAAL
jgi:hypothetical protein